MPDSKMLQKAGKITFLLVCLFLCTACGKEKAVFDAGTQLNTDRSVEAEQSVEEESPEVVLPKEENVDHGLVNINKADAEELMTLPGIGKVRAQAIIEHRKNYGDFEKIEDIMNVKGIKTGVFSKINSLICVK